MKLRWDVYLISILTHVELYYFSVIDTDMRDKYVSVTDRIRKIKFWEAALDHTDFLWIMGCEVFISILMP